MSITETVPVDEDAVSLKTKQILAIIYEYRLTKLADSHDLWTIGTPKFLAVIERYVRANTMLRMCLPAFPWKSANKIQKALGVLPDKAEEVALTRLDEMCARISHIYKPGAKLLIISDGLVYNDLLTIPDRDVWAYGQALRALGAKLSTHIEFSRLKDLVKIDLPAQLEEITYVANASNFRRALLNQFGRDDIDVRKEIAEKEDTRLTYLGYTRFLENDLRYIFPLNESRSGHAYRRNVKFIAREMIKRGAAFAEAVSQSFGDYLRLSIHQSTGANKISINLLPTSTRYTTPWHCAAAYNLDGTFTSGPKGDFEADPRYELVMVSGRPSHYVEKKAVVAEENKENMAIDSNI